MKLKNEVESVWRLYSNLESPTIKKIYSFIGLPRGWHYGEGRPASKRTAERTKSLLEIAGSNGFKKSDAFPGVDGEIMLSLYENNDMLEFLIEPSGWINFVSERGGHRVKELEGINMIQAIREIKDSRKILWSSSDYSPLNTTMQSVEGSKVSGSKIRGRGEVKTTVFQSSAESVPLELVAASA